MSMEEIEAHRAASLEKERKLYEQLSQGELVEIEGLSWGLGVTGQSTPPATMWNLRLELVAWKTKDGPLRECDLSVTRKVDDAELKTLQEKIEKNALVRMRVRLVEACAAGKPHALLEELLEGEEFDEAVVSFRTARLTPVTQEDEVLGLLTKDLELGDFEGRALWNGAEVAVRLETDDAKGVAPALRVAHELWRSQTSWSEKLAQAAVEHGLALKNENWLDEGEAELDAAAFLERMRLEEITVYADGAFSFWHDDGDLFWGHAIMIDGDLNRGFTDFDIPG